MASNFEASPSNEPGKDLIVFDRTKKQALFSKHKNAIVSTLEVSDFSDNQIFYCVDKLEREGKVISGASLTRECLDLEVTFANYLERNDDAKEDVTISELIAVESRRSEPVASHPAAGGHSAVTQTPAASGGSDSPNHRKKAKRRNRSSNRSPANVSANSEHLSLPEIISSSHVTSPGPTRTHRSPGADLDVVDFAGLGSFSAYEDQVDNLQAVSFSSTLEPSPVNTKLDQRLFENGASGYGFSDAEPLKPKSDARPNEGQDGERTRAALVKECLHAVTKENNLLETTRMCTMCRVNPRGITFLPCGHFLTCRECAGPVYVCSVCKKNILATVETYLC
ncbi:unnamed protein product [Lymnaea stagnalis]|uniref:RING-type domain-containing protein n=1 Tax=Lymnaea stagnalis TaxID=6523 RepID=A0AAV2HW24_LYMST